MRGGGGANVSKPGKIGQIWAIIEQTSGRIRAKIRYSGIMGKNVCAPPPQ